MQVRRSESRSTPKSVMHFKTKVHEKQAEKEPFVVPYRTRSVSVAQCGWSNMPEIKNQRSRGQKSPRIDKETYDGRALLMCALSDKGLREDVDNVRLEVIDLCKNMKVEEVHKDGDHEDMDTKLQEAWNDVSNVALDPKEVRRATLEEIQYIEDEKVWRRIPRQGVLHRVQDREGSGVRLTAPFGIVETGMLQKNITLEMKIGFSASTPPLEALRPIISDAATRDQQEDKVIRVNNVARAFFEAPVRRTIFKGPGRVPITMRRSGRC